MAEPGVDARRQAAELLVQVLGERRLMHECLASGMLDALPADERARAQRLATDALRGMERADRLLGRHLRKAPPLFVRNVLRIATVELCGGTAAHGAVNAAVNVVAGHRRHAPLKGLVNAVLRKVAQEGPQAWNALRVPRLPKWLRAPMLEAWGKDAVTGMEAAHFAGAPLDLTPKHPDPALAAELDAEVLPTGGWRLPRAAQVSALPGFAAGQWWVQDAAAAIPAQVLAPRPGERIADLCAAPGGKTMQLAAAGATVTAIDNSSRRMERVRENLARTGLHATLRVGDLLAEPVQGDAGQYDAVLLDAPCSATGTIRRHPDLPHAKDGAEFAALIAQQGTFIDHAWKMLRPGGRLVYCTCSLLPDEGEVQVEEALARLPDAAIDRAALDLPGIDPAWITEEGGLRLRPDFWAARGAMDGFYIAALRKAVAPDA